MEWGHNETFDVVSLAFPPPNHLRLLNVVRFVAKITGQQFFPEAITLVKMSANIVQRMLDVR